MKIEQLPFILAAIAASAALPVLADATEQKALQAQPSVADTQATKQENTGWSDENGDDAWSDEQWGDDQWGDDTWSEQQDSAWQISGFGELGYGHFLQNNIVQSSSSLKEARGRIDINYSHDVFEFDASGDLLVDGVLNDTLWQTRELSISASPLSMLDVKIGRQVLTWGTGDYVFLNDLFAKDWQSFFSGRDDEYLKAPSDSVRLTAYANDITFDFAWTPQFTPDHYLTGERFSFYSPFHGENIAPGEDFNVQQTKDDQYSARIATTINNTEIALYGYKGYWTTPVSVNHQGQAYFSQMNSWGASAIIPFAKGLFNAEFAYYDSVEDAQGDQANIANSQLRFLLGYEQELAKDLTVSTQYYLEKTLDYDNYQLSHPNKDEAVAEHRHVLTTRLRYATHQQNVLYNLFAFYSPTDNDGYIKPSITYRYSDDISFSVGANLFFGQQVHTFFAQHKDNSNAWLRMRVHY
ncbi:hypothetical protein [Thalassotalea sp. PLHSN55]|uniref:hypothetical protein n=1 Tax=Thalassotalea sp. PLHSN55 TaxID=3435888 RepID=UPI003F874424